MTITGEPVASASKHAGVQWARIMRALVLFFAGMTITFTQTLHNNLFFNAWVFSIFTVVHALVIFASIFPIFNLREQLGSLTLATVSLAAGIVAPFMPTTAGLATVILIWAAATALIELWRWFRSRQQDLLILGILAGLLAVVLAFAATELPAITGFFGAYCIIAGVYLGIASFDSHSPEDGNYSRESTET